MAKPYVDLFGSGRVKEPLVEGVEKLWKGGWVAIHLAELIGFLVLRERVKHVDREPHASEACLPQCKNMFEEDAIAVKEAEGGARAGIMGRESGQ